MVKLQFLKICPFLFSHERGEERKKPMQSSKTDRRVKYTKMVLKESLIELLEQKPISRITIKEICEQADINRGTFYAHYSDQYDLLHKIEQELLDDITKYLASYDFQASKPDSIQIITQVFEYVLQNGKLCQVLLGENGDIEFQEKIMRIVQRQCIEEWTVKKSVDTETAEYLYLFVIHGSIGLVRKWLHNGMKKPTDEIAQMVVRLTYDGLSAFI